MGQPYSTVLISPPIIRLSSLSRSFSHSLTGSVPEAVLKNLAGRIFSESFMHMLYHIWYNMSSLWLCGKKGKGACAGYLGHPFRKRRLESDLQAPFCLQESSGNGRIREQSCISYVGWYLALFAKEKPVFHILIPIRQRIALSFHALHVGLVDWMKPRSTSPVLGTVADLAKGKSVLLVENALLRQQLTPAFLPFSQHSQLDFHVLSILFRFLQHNQ
jgi:hypothetical protein